MLEGVKVGMGMHLTVGYQTQQQHTQLNSSCAVTLSPVTFATASHLFEQTFNVHVHYYRCSYSLPHMDACGVYRGLDEQGTGAGAPLSQDISQCDLMEG